MKSDYLVSIIMTCHNGELYLKKAIASLLQQTYSKWELVFYDNYSNDSSYDIINSYNDSRIKYFKSNTLLNLGTVRNVALEKCTGSFISFLDVDDYWSIDKLEKQVNKLKLNKNIDIVYSNYFIIEKGEIKRIKKKMLNGYCQSDIIYSYINGLPLTAWLTLMIRKSAIDKLEYSFDKNLHVSSDFDLIIRLSNFCNFDFIDDYLAFYRLHFFNESKNKNKEVEELAYILMKYKDNKKINLLFNKNNFADKIFIKNFLLKENSNKFKMNYTQINNKFFMLLYFVISIIPKKILNIFYK
jgi:glycosyltransferase involved in cell wall biosynthesis